MWSAIPVALLCMVVNWKERLGSSPPRGQSPVDYRGLSFIYLSVCPPRLSGLKSALSGLKSAHLGLKSALKGFDSEKADFRPERADLRPERKGFRP